MEMINLLTEEILGCAFKVHTALGPGLLESSYKECLYYELNKAGLYTEKEKGLPLVYESVKLDVGYRIDLLVENKVVIETKAIEAITDVHVAQVITYLKLSGCKVGLLLNFHCKHLKDGIKRIVY
jgi:GxxExxY protein